MLDHYVVVARPEGQPWKIVGTYSDFETARHAKIANENSLIYPKRTFDALGFGIIRAILTADKSQPPRRQVEVDGTIFDSITDVMDFYEINHNTALNWIRMGKATYYVVDKDETPSDTKVEGEQYAE